MEQNENQNIAVMSYATLNDGTHNMRYTRMVPKMVSIIIQLGLGVQTTRTDI